MGRPKGSKNKPKGKPLGRPKGTTVEFLANRNAAIMQKPVAIRCPTILGKCYVCGFHVGYSEAHCRHLLTCLECSIGSARWQEWYQASGRNTSAGNILLRYSQKGN